MSYGIGKFFGQSVLYQHAWECHLDNYIPIWDFGVNVYGIWYINFGFSMEHLESLLISRKTRDAIFY